MEEQGTARLAEGKITKFVQNDQIDIAKQQRESSSLTGRLLPLERIDQVRGREETHTPPVLSDAADA